MDHPEFVYSRGLAFPSRWALAARQAKTEEAERALYEISRGHLSEQDAALLAKRALDRIDRIGPVICEGCDICKPQ